MIISFLFFSLLFINSKPLQGTGNLVKSVPLSFIINILSHHIFCGNISFAVSFSSDQMTFYWTGPNSIAEDSDSGHISLSPVLKKHNAYLIHNETLYCGEEQQWRGKVESFHHVHCGQPALETFIILAGLFIT